MARWKMQSSQKIAESTLFELKEHKVSLPNGNEKTYTIFDLPDFAAVLPVFDDKIVLIKNYRYPVDKNILEIPAGFIEKGEEPRKAAQRELEEETGYLLKECEKLCEYHPVASLNDQVAHLFSGPVKKGGKIDREEGEEMEVTTLSISKVYEMLENNEISHPHTQIALYRAEKYLK